MTNEDNNAAAADKIELPRALKKIGKDFGFKEKTLEILVENDIDTVPAMKSLSLEDIVELGLTMGQRNLLKSCVASLKESQRTEPDVSASVTVTEARDAMDAACLRSTEDHVSELKLVYFSCKGRAQAIRYLLEDNKIDYSYEAVPVSAWEDRKGETLFGQLPMIYYDENKQLAETGAIIRHLARKHKLYGDTEDEQAEADMMYEAVIDIFQKFGEMLYSMENYDEEKEKFMQKLPERLKPLETQLKKVDKGNSYFVSKKITFADYAVFDILYNLNGYSPGCLDDFPLLKSFLERMCKRENIEQFIDREDMKAMRVTIHGQY